MQACGVVATTDSNIVSRSLLVKASMCSQVVPSQSASDNTAIFGAIAYTCLIGIVCSVRLGVRLR